MTKNDPAAGCPSDIFRGVAPARFVSKDTPRRTGSSGGDSGSAEILRRPGGAGLARNDHVMADRAGFGFEGALRQAQESLGMTVLRAGAPPGRLYDNDESRERHMYGWLVIGLCRAHC